MEREIKFRAFYDNRMHDNKEAMRILYNNSSEYTLTPKYPIMQFTGLKDKNGKEIYDGDIIKWKRLSLSHSIPMDHKKAMAKYDPMSVGVVFYGDDLTWRVNEESKSIHHLLINEFRECEVIGNIYSNPELLNQKDLNHA